jgi:hypothetical protein
MQDLRDKGGDGVPIDENGNLKYVTVTPTRPLLDISEVSLTRINLQEGDTLLIKVKSPTEFTHEAMGFIQGQFESLFPNNAVMLLGVKPDQDVSLEVVRDYTSRAPKVSNCAEPTSYCDDCSCGKREQILSEQGEL